ncbi:MAG: DUF2807 domain-containing protein [Marinilabiliales bacterium]|nr:DUF2807 domain-containing protein [Marinilabiliales bacterium]
MKKLFALAVLVLFLPFQAHTGAGPHTPRQRNVSGFSEVGFGVAGEVYIISLGNEYSVVLEGDRDYISEIETSVSAETSSGLKGTNGLIPETGK